MICDLEIWINLLTVFSRSAVLLSHLHLSLLWNSLPWLLFSGGAHQTHASRREHSAVGPGRFFLSWRGRLGRGVPSSGRHRKTCWPEHTGEESGGRIWVQRLRASFQLSGQPAAAPAHPHRREALRLPWVRRAFPARRASQEPPPQPQRSPEPLPLPAVW